MGVGQGGHVLHGGVVESDSIPVLGLGSVPMLVMLGHTGQALHWQGGDEEGGVDEVVVKGSDVVAEDADVVRGDGGLVGGVSRVVGGAADVISGGSCVIPGASVGQIFPLSAKVTSARCTQFEPGWRKNCNVSV